MINRLSVTQKLVLSFVFVIIVGSILLSLPISHYANSPETSYLDHLFNTVSMVCVTGLSVIPVSKAYNGFGQIISILLMQTGGLGLVSLIAFSTYTLKNKLGLSDQDLLQSALSRDNQKDLKVSAFCNAGFDNLGANSLQDYATNPTINLSVAFLIMSGSLGFAVWIDLIQLIRRYFKDRPRNWKLASRPFSNQSRLVLISTSCLLLGGTLLAWLLEMDNAKTIGTLNVWQQLLVSFFQTVTMRTAGFATISYTNADFSTNLLFMIQMIIGGGPGGTAGGIKVTTASIMFLLFKSELSGKSSVVFRNRIISNKTVMQAFTVTLFFLTMLFVGYVILLETNPTLSPLALLFESISAIATVGVSMDLTSSLNTMGRLVIMALMFIGRVGPITVLLSLMTKKEKHVSYAPTDISVG